MDKHIFLNQSVSLDLPTLLDTRLLVQANSGGGKSWLLRRLLEQSQGKVQQIAIDLEGEFATLREKYDYVLAGKEGDTPAEPGLGFLPVVASSGYAAQSYDEYTTTVLL